jgi:hypothetical protein
LFENRVLTRSGECEGVGMEKEGCEQLEVWHAHVYSCIILSADFSAIVICLPFGSLNLQFPPVQEIKVKVIPEGILPNTASV